MKLHSNVLYIGDVQRITASLGNGWVFKPCEGVSVYLPLFLCKNICRVCVIRSSSNAWVAISSNYVKALLVSSVVGFYLGQKDAMIAAANKHLTGIKVLKSKH